ncbi:MAG: hypothetical protein HY974_02280 [Candidatus Kerfeldbacteria bacterium]|nr:hypothetical protein [Candidatus Kerfeldbacteria bacterium]
MSQSPNKLDIITAKITSWIGSTSSLVTHTVIFIGVMLAPFFGFTLEYVLLVLTTIVSLEAIYLSIFIQYTVNRHSETLQDVAEDIEDVAEDVEEVTKNVEEISEDVVELSEDVEDISEDVDVISSSHRQIIETPISDYDKLTNTLRGLLAEVERIRSQQAPPKS